MSSLISSPNRIPPYSIDNTVGKSQPNIYALFNAFCCLRQYTSGFPERVWVHLSKCCLGTNRGSSYCSTPRTLSSSRDTTTSHIPYSSPHQFLSTFSTSTESMRKGKSEKIQPKKHGKEVAASAFECVPPPIISAFVAEVLFSRVRCTLPRKNMHKMD